MPRPTFSAHLIARFKASPPYASESPKSLSNNEVKVICWSCGRWPASGFATQVADRSKSCRCKLWQRPFSALDSATQVDDICGLGMGTVSQFWERFESGVALLVVASFCFSWEGGELLLVQKNDWGPSRVKLWRACVSSSERFRGLLQRHKANWGNFQIACEICGVSWSTDWHAPQAAMAHTRWTQKRRVYIRRYNAEQLCTVMF